MQIKENVYEATPQTEDGAAAQEEKIRDQEKKENASTVLGKFKDVDALARAYSALEAEFTRRSQRLKELEKKAENWDGDGAGNVGVEKLRKNARMHREENKQFDEFLREVGQASLETEPTQPVDEDSEKEQCVVEETRAAEPMTAENTGNTENAAEDGLGTGENKEEMTDTPKGGAVRAEELSLPVEHKQETELSSEELFEKACQNEGVRLKIIGEYLTSIGKSGAPVTAGRGGLLVTPPVKARSIDDAGGMALQYFKKGLSE